MRCNHIQNNGATFTLLPLRCPEPAADFIAYVFEDPSLDVNNDSLLMVILG